jgi:putative glutamine amidotransferase
MAPVIGVTSIPRTARTAFARVAHETVPELYLESVVRWGAVPVILPVHGPQGEDLIDRLDGLLLTGGGDVDPALYGRETRPEVSHVDEARDRMEIELVRRALELEVPVLAVCRGTQVLNVALGGTLIPDIPSEVGTEVEHWDLDRWDRPAHVVEVERESLLGELVGDRIEVNSMHHQAADELGQGLWPVARAPDGVVEAVDAPARRFCLGVQWHPECLPPDHPGHGIFRELVKAAEERAK